jgi:two-component system CheB/CheR fusion protein
VLGRDIIPKLFAGKGSGDQVRAGIVGCASGEEAYSIAILLLEHVSTLDNAPKIQIFATLTLMIKRSRQPARASMRRQLPSM